MPRVQATVIVEVPVEVAFAVSQTQGEIRYRWDNFVRNQRLLHGADEPGIGVQTETVSRHGLRMVSEYTSFRPPNQVGMKMVGGPWFFRTFGGGWSFKPLDEARTEATWRYTFAVRPRWLAPIADRIGIVVLARDIRRRIAGYAKGCADPVVLDAVRRHLEDGRTKG
ncbi:MAG: SRPBCC family protein [Actinomycetota bacterium]